MLSFKLKRKSSSKPPAEPGLTVLDNPDIVNQCSSEIDFSLRDKEEVKREVEEIIRNANSDKGKD